MRILCTLLLFEAVILNSIELGSLSKRASDGSLNRGSDRSRPSSSASAELPLRERSRSPTLKDTFPSVLGFRLKDLASIRLMPHTNPHRVFELRRYIFPPDKPIGLRTRVRELSPMPTKEQIVLSTSNGDVCAILEKAVSRVLNFRAIFTSISGKSVRAKINMDSGAVERLTAREISECPPTYYGKVLKSYGILQSRNQSEGLLDDGSNPGLHRHGPTPSSPLGRDFPNRTHSSANPHHSDTSSPRAGSLSLDGSNSPTQWDTFPRLLGFNYEDLESIRLSPRNNPNRVLELRRYVFPPGKPIRLRTRTHILIPMPTGQQIVLSTSNGDVYAILERARRDTDIRAIFTPVIGMSERAKINMNSGEVEEMNAEEIADCPVPARALVSQLYKVFLVRERSGDSS